MAPEHLRTLRQAHALTLRDLASIVDVTPQYLSMVERGKKPPSDNLLTQLATYYRMERAQFGPPPKRGRPSKRDLP